MADEELRGLEAPMCVSQRKCLMAVLVVCFIVMTVLVYTDGAGRTTPPLSPRAREGLALWQRNNCQSCHQIYGFGGFLGPDLTNACRTLTRVRLETILTDGSAQMPAFAMKPDQIDAIEAFLRELDRTGVARPAAARPAVSPMVHLRRAVDDLAREHALPAEAAAGLAYVEQAGCVACHQPGTKVVGPDLTTLGRLSAAELIETVTAGRLDRGMPRFKLGPPERAGLVALLGWLHRHGERIARDYAEHARPRAAAASSLPWWEYE